MDRLVRMALGVRPRRLVLLAVSLLMPRRGFEALFRLAPGVRLERGVVVLSFDVDLPEDVRALPWLLERLEGRSFRAVFGCIGRWVEREPEVFRAVVEAGHEVMNHSYSHPSSEVFNPRRFADLSVEERWAEVRCGHEVIAERLGYEPVGFRVPHLMNVEGVHGMLAGLGYRYSSSVLARRLCAGPVKVDGVWEFPLTQCPRHFASAFDTYHAFRGRSWMRVVRRESEDRFEASFRFLLEWAARERALVNLYFDPMDVCRLRGVDRLLDAVEERQDRLDVLTYRELVDRLEGGEGGMW